VARQILDSSPGQESGAAGRIAKEISDFADKGMALAGVAHGQAVSGTGHGDVEQASLVVATVGPPARIDDGYMIEFEPFGAVSGHQLKRGIWAESR
jgi:hypothetical protein